MASRAYRLKPGESLPEGIVRIAQGRIEHALEELRGKSESSPAESVHEARKDMKKLRALLRLVRGEIGDKVFRREAAVFRDAARELAGMRDADVMLATLAELGERYADDLPAEASGGLRQALEAHRIRTTGGARPAAARPAIEMLEQARGRVEAWPLERDDFGAVEPGLRRSYRQGRRRYRATREEPSVENLHEWRKRVKDLWYHCSILESTWEPVMKALADEAHTLSERLGADHDLAVLLGWARQHGTTEVAEALEPRVGERREQLQAEAFACGARLYADKPSAFTGRVGRWWRASAGEARARTVQR